MNWLDWMVVLILAINGLVAYQRGLIISLFKLTSLIISLFLTYKLYPVVSTFLRKSTGIYEGLKEIIMNSLHLENAVENTTLNGQTQFINSLDLPPIIKSTLIENNNNEIYKLLNVQGINDYVGGYIANIGINILAMIIVLMVVMMGLRIVVTILDLVAKLPILNSINKMSGFILGLLSGTIQVWILCIGITFFYTNKTLEPVLTALEASSIAHYFFENNVLLFMVLKLFA